MPLGSYMAHIYQQENQVRVQFDDFDATLGMDGLMSIEPDGNYTFDAILQPREGLAAEVREPVQTMNSRCQTDRAEFSSAARKVVRNFYT